MLKKFIMDAFVDNMLPLSLIDKKLYRKQFSLMPKNYRIWNRATLKSKIENDYYTRKTDLIKKLSETEFVCTTADIWSTHTNSFLGVTCHIINANLERESFTLDCSAFNTAHNFEAIAEKLNCVHSDFGLSTSKIVATVTDNAFNFVKAFKEFGIEYADPVYPDSSEDEEDIENDGLDPEFATMEEKSDDSIFLPLHLRFASHTLCLETGKNCTYLVIYCAIKLQKL